MEGWGKGCGLHQVLISEVEGGLMHQEAFNLNTHTHKHTPMPNSNCCTEVPG